MKFKKILIIFLTTAAATAVVCYFFSETNNQPAVSGDKTISKEKTYAQILFVGDLMFDRGIRYYAQNNGGNDFIFNEIYPTLLENDIVIANLEGPITDNKSISAGTVPGSNNNYIFTFDKSLAKTLFQKNIRIVNLGNNHILNFGSDGLTSTKKYLAEAQVSYFGSPDYSKSISININGVKITLISYNEFSNLQEGIEITSTIEEIQKANQYSDIVIMFCHWGSEYEKNPSDSQINLAHQLIDNGADLIIGSHPHVIQFMEIYNDKRIYYSLGNFIFDQYFNENVRNGLGIVVTIDKNSDKMNFEEKHFYLKDNGQTRLADQEIIEKTQ